MRSDLGHPGAVSLRVANILVAGDTVVIQLRAVAAESRAIVLQLTLVPLGIGYRRCLRAYHT
jgi:hypothetical protein